MKIGLVGKANVGKSTFFKAATLADTTIANYPFATIEPNHGVGYVSVDCVEEEFNVTCDPQRGFCRDGKRFIPVDIIDVAGLVPDAHEGKGLGSQFLSDLNEADVLIHVIDASGGTNAEGEPVPAGSYDPAQDVTFLEEELDYWYHDILTDGWDKLLRRVAAEDIEAETVLHEQMSGVGVTEAMAEHVIRNHPPLEEWDEDILFDVARALREQSKPMVIAANKADVETVDDVVNQLQEEFPQYPIIATSAESELALRQADANDVIDYIPGSNDFNVKQSDIGEDQREGLSFLEEVLDRLERTGVQSCLNTAVFDVLEYKAVFPGGVDNLQDADGNTLPDCFLLPSDATALDFAYFLHSDIGDNFVQAIDVREDLPVGKDKVLEHRDVIKIESS